MHAPTLSYKRNKETRLVLLCCDNSLGKCSENTRETCKITTTERYSSFFLFLIIFQFFFFLIVFFIQVYI